MKISEWLGIYYSLETTVADHNGTDVGVKYQTEMELKRQIFHSFIHLSHCDHLELFRENSKAETAVCGSSIFDGWSGRESLVGAVGLWPSGH